MIALKVILFSALLCAMGTIATIWLLLGWTFRRLDLHSAEFLFVKGDAPELEQSVQRFLWLQKTGLVSRKLLLVDMGLTQDAQKRAELLSAVQTAVEYITIQALCARLDGERDEGSRDGYAAGHGADRGLPEP